MADHPNTRKRRTPVVRTGNHQPKHPWGATPFLNIPIGQPFWFTKHGVGLLIDSLRLAAGCLDEQVSDLLRQDPPQAGISSRGYPAAVRACELRELADVLFEATSVHVEFKDPGEAA